MTFRTLHSNVRIRIGVGFLQRLLYIMVMPLMTIFLASRFGAALAGAMMLAAVSFEVVGTLLGGHLSDLHGRRPLLLAGELGVALSFGVMALAASSWWSSAIAVYLAFSASNFAASLALPANDAMIVDVTTSEIRKYVYTVNYWAINLALACGVLVGGFLYTSYFAYLLVAAAAVSAGIFGVTLRWIAETAPVTEIAPSGKTRLRDFVDGYRVVLRDRVFAALIGAATLRMVLEVQINYYIAVRVAETFGRQTVFSLDGWHVNLNGVEILGVLRAENTVLVVLLAFAFHWIFRRTTDKLRLYVGDVLFTAGYMVLAVTGNGLLMLGAMLVVTIGELMNAAVQQALLADLVPDVSRTRYMAVYNLNVRLALLIASLGITVGSLVSPWGVAAIYGVFGAAILLQYRFILAARSTRATPELGLP